MVAQGSKLSGVSDCLEIRWGVCCGCCLFPLDLPSEGIGEGGNGGGRGAYLAIGVPFSPLPPSHG